DCTKIVGDDSVDDALVVGVVVQLSGQLLNKGPSLIAAMELAQDEIAQTAGGVPGMSGRKRPLVLVECDESQDPVRAARHLVDEAGLPALLGPTFSGQVVSVATTVTLPAGALLVPPTATSPALTQLEDQGLLWRTVPSDALQGGTLVQLVADLQTNLS